jgi:hypothetical protein
VQLSVRHEWAGTLEGSLLYGEQRTLMLCVQNIGTRPVHELELRIRHLFALNSMQSQALYYTEDEFKPAPAANPAPAASSTTPSATVATSPPLSTTSASASAPTPSAATLAAATSPTTQPTASASASTSSASGAVPSGGQLTRPRSSLTDGAPLPLPPALQHQSDEDAEDVDGGVSDAERDAEEDAEDADTAGGDDSATVDERREFRAMERRMKQLALQQPTPTAASAAAQQQLMNEMGPVTRLHSRRRKHSRMRKLRPPVPAPASNSSTTASAPPPSSTVTNSELEVKQPPTPNHATATLQSPKSNTQRPASSGRTGKSAPASAPQPSSALVAAPSLSARAAAARGLQRDEQELRAFHSHQVLLGWDRALIAHQLPLLPGQTLTLPVHVNAQPQWSLPARFWRPPFLFGSEVMRVFVLTSVVVPK